MIYRKTFIIEDYDLSGLSALEKESNVETVEIDIEISFNENSTELEIEFHIPAVRIGFSDDVITWGNTLKFAGIYDSHLKLPESFNLNDLVRLDKDFMFTIDLDSEMVKMIKR